MAHVHRCMRCNIDFECPNEGHCLAGFNVLPNVFVEKVLTEHCPMNPDWTWIRDYAKRYAAQLSEYREHEGMPCWEEIPVSNGEIWREEK